MVLHQKFGRAHQYRLSKDTGLNPAKLVHGASASIAVSPAEISPEACSSPVSGILKVNSHVSPQIVSIQNQTSNEAGSNPAAVPDPSQRPECEREAMDRGARRGRGTAVSPVSTAQIDFPPSADSSSPNASMLGNSAPINQVFPATSYASLLDPDEGNCLKFIPAGVFNGVAYAQLESDDVAAEIAYWVLCSVLGANPSFEIIQNLDTIRNAPNCARSQRLVPG
ncbi:hypothetical protein Cgig2_024134 [Carnegiea gigantea]|uniref:Uncharacterized protein n=1 Tax=Carnegiea gigantea TaxID=171969 RepID=A0A9Q1GZ20_9CARY|nr:hypothetical protein Cgig2_024134 [Carnegiea gigantea]